MKQVEMSHYEVAEGETVKVSFETPPDVRIFAVLDGLTLPINNNRIKFIVTGEEPSHKLFLEFLQSVTEGGTFPMHLSGSGGGDFDVIIDMAHASPVLTMYIRFSVKGHPFRLGVAGA